jgi:hypothetical protein
MGLGNISHVDRSKRLQEIKSLTEDGLNDQEIADKTTLPIQTVKRYQKYLKELALSDLTPEQIAEKRSEIYLELLEAGEKAKKLHDKYEIEEGKGTTARGYFYIQLKTIELKMRLYGLEKIEPTVQVNTQNIYNTEPEKVDHSDAIKIADILKSSHEKRLKENFKDE